MAFLYIEFDGCLTTNTSELKRFYVEDTIGNLPEDEALAANSEKLEQKEEIAKTRFFNDLQFQQRYLQPTEGMLQTLLYLKSIGIEIGIVTKRPSECSHSIAKLILCNWLAFTANSGISNIFSNTFSQFRADLGIINAEIKRLSEQSPDIVLDYFMQNVVKTKLLGYIDNIIEVSSEPKISNNGQTYYCSNNPRTLEKPYSPNITQVYFSSNGSGYKLSGIPENIVKITSPSELASYIAALES